VAIGHVTKLSAAPSERFEGVAKRWPTREWPSRAASDDLYLMGRHMSHNVMRGEPLLTGCCTRGSTARSHQQRPEPVHAVGDCRHSAWPTSTPYCQVGAREDVRACSNDHDPLARSCACRSMVSRLGNPRSGGAGLPGSETAIAELAAPLYGFKPNPRVARRYTGAGRAAPAALTEGRNGSDDQSKCGVAAPRRSAGRFCRVNHVALEPTGRGADGLSFAAKVCSTLPATARASAIPIGCGHTARDHDRSRR